MISVTFFKMSFLSFLSNVLEKTNFVFGELLMTLLVIFFTEFRELMPLVMSYVPAWLMMQPGLPATKFSIYSNIFSKIPPETFFTVAWCLFESPFSLIQLRREAPVTTNFFLFNCFNSMHFFPLYFRLNTVIEGIVFHTSSSYFFCN